MGFSSLARGELGVAGRLLFSWGCYVIVAAGDVVVWVTRHRWVGRWAGKAVTMMTGVLHVRYMVIADVVLGDTGVGNSAEVEPS